MEEGQKWSSFPLWLRAARPDAGRLAGGSPLTRSECARDLPPARHGVRAHPHHNIPPGPARIYPCLSREACGVGRGRSPARGGRVSGQQAYTRWRRQGSAPRAPPSQPLPAPALPRSRGMRPIPSFMRRCGVSGVGVGCVSSSASVPFFLTSNTNALADGLRVGGTRSGHRQSTSTGACSMYLARLWRTHTAHPAPVPPSRTLFCFFVFCSLSPSARTSWRRT